MYTILIFGFTRTISTVINSLSSYPFKIIHITKPEDLHSIAFSRLFDAWLFDTEDTGFDRVSLEDLLANRKTPLVFLVPGPQNTLASKSCIAIAPEQLEHAGKIIHQILHAKSEQHKERYLAGYIQDPPGIESLLSKSATMQELIGLIKDIAPTDSPILLQGETGTGKELFATILHNESRRSTGPFMAVNCGALPDTLLESELFGHEKGAFTGAVSRHIGKIEHASGGTLFLDEIESMSPAMQVRLLRILQEKSLQRLGGNTDICTDFRVIGATNVDPSELLQSGRLRSDLYYRLSVFQLHLPPLRNRTEDIPLLVQHFINRKRCNGREYVKGIDHEALRILLSAPWHGNIRELQNVIERAVMLETSEIISTENIQLPNHPLPENEISPFSLKDHAFAPGITLKSYKTFLNQTAEQHYLIGLLKYTEGKIGEAAQLAGLTPRALYTKMKIHGLKKENYKNSEL